MRIGVLSDTHGMLKDTFITELKSCDYIIHAGDIGTEKCYQALKDLSIPLYMVRGNCDHGLWATYLPETLAFPIAGLTFYLIHDLNKMPYVTDEPDVVIFGHTHQHTSHTRRGCTYINPGSAGKSRGLSGASIAILTIENKSVSCRFITT